MDRTPVAAGISMLPGKEERLLDRKRQLVGSLDRPPGNVGVGAQAIGIDLPIMHMPAQQVLLTSCSELPSRTESVSRPVSGNRSISNFFALRPAIQPVSVEPGLGLVVHQVGGVASGAKTKLSP